VIEQMRPVGSNAPRDTGRTCATSIPALESSASRVPNRTKYGCVLSLTEGLLFLCSGHLSSVRGTAVAMNDDQGLRDAPVAPSRSEVLSTVGIILRFMLAAAIITGAIAVAARLI